MITAKDLERFGLSEKEAKVYLAALELGPATATHIAQKARVNRATTYVQIEELMKMGLMSTHERDKTTLFAAESPEALKRRLLRTEERVKAGLSALGGILPELLKIYEYAEEKPKVRFFEGKEGLLSIRDDFLKTKDKKIEEVYSMDEIRNVFSEKELQESLAIRKQKGIKARGIYIRKEGKVPNVPLPNLTDVRIVPHDRFPIHSDILLYDQKVAIISLKGKPVGVIIDHKEIAETLRTIFNLAWVAAEKYQ